MEEILEGVTEDATTGSTGENVIETEAVVDSGDTQGGAERTEAEEEVVSDSSPEDENVAPPIIQVQFCSWRPQR